MSRAIIDLFKGRKEAANYERAVVAIEAWGTEPFTKLDIRLSMRRYSGNRVAVEAAVKELMHHGLVRRADNRPGTNGHVYRVTA